MRLRSEGQRWRQIALALGVPFSTVVDACRAEQRRIWLPQARNKAEING